MNNLTSPKVKPRKKVVEKRFTIDDLRKAWKDGRDGTKVVGSFPFITTVYINQTFENYVENLG